MADTYPTKLVSIENPRRLTGKWIYTILWSAVSCGVLFASVAWYREAAGIAAGIVLSLLGIALLYGVIRATLEHLKYRQVRLVVARPPATGAKLEAVLELPAAAPPDGHLVAELACVQLRWSRNEKSGKEYLSERDVWTGQQALRVLRGPITSQAAVAIDIPQGRPASSLPDERLPNTFFRAPSSSGSRSLDHAYHRWELRIRAHAPGMDLERTYPLHVGAGRAAAPSQETAIPAPRRAPPALAGAFVELAPRQLWTRFASPTLRGTVGLGIAAVVGGAFLAADLYDAGELHLGPLDAALRAALGRPWPDMRLAGFEIQPENPTYVGIGARGISVEQHGDELRVHVREIRLENARGRHTARYMRIGGVLYRAGDWPSQSYGYAWHDLRGVLTPDVPGVTLHDQVFRFGMAQSRCADGGCELRLLVVVQDDMDAPRRDHSLPARLATVVAR